MIVLDAARFRTIAPEVYEQDGFCGRNEVALWRSVSATAVIGIGNTDPACELNDDELTIDLMIDRFQWLKDGNARQEGKSIRVQTLGVPMWVYFIRRDDQPCIVFNSGIGKFGDKLQDTTQIIIGFFCDKSAETVTPTAAKAFVKSIRVNGKPAS